MIIMNGNLVQITKKDGIYVNGTKISNVLGYRINNMSYDKVMTMEIEFDVGDVEVLEHAPEIPEEDYVKLTVSLDETEAAEKLNSIEKKINQLLSALEQCRKTADDVRVTCD